MATTYRAALSLTITVNPTLYINKGDEVTVLDTGDVTVGGRTIPNLIPTIQNAVRFGWLVPDLLAGSVPLVDVSAATLCGRDLYQLR